MRANQIARNCNDFKMDVIKRTHWPFCLNKAASSKHIELLISMVDAKPN